MANGHIYFEIHVEDPERAIKFYTSIFDWKFTKLDVVEHDYWNILTGGAFGGMMKRPMP